MFAKLYDNEDGTQILVKIDEGEKGPEVRFFFEPQGLGTCSAALQWEDSGEGWDMAESLFAGVSEESAIDFTAGAKRALYDIRADDPS